MIFLEKPFVSKTLLKYLAESNEPVYKNEFAANLPQGEYKLNLVSKENFEQVYNQNKHLYTVSENALSQVLDLLPKSELAKNIKLLKNKATFRKICAEQYPNFFFKELSVNELLEIDVKTLKLPVVLKPSVGFFSVGVYTIESEADWADAMEKIRSKSYNQNFPKSVVEMSKFIIEQYITGEEYAVDAYYNKDGKPVILNIFHHKFASATDVSDRMYYSSKSLYDRYYEQFNNFLVQINKALHLTTFPFHIEFRVENNVCIPIEMNLMRFAGLCLNEVQTYIGGIHPVHAFLNDITPDYDAMWRGKEHDNYAFVVLDAGGKKPDLEHFDYDAFRANMTDVLELRKPADDKLGIYGFMFCRIPESKPEETDWIMSKDLSEFVK